MDLVDVAALELRTVPDIAGGPARAVLAEWRKASDAEWWLKLHRCGGA